MTELRRLSLAGVGHGNGPNLKAEARRTWTQDQVNSVGLSFTQDFPRLLFSSTHIQTDNLYLSTTQWWIQLCSLRGRAQITH